MIKRNHKAGVFHDMVRSIIFARCKYDIVFASQSYSELFERYRAESESPPLYRFKRQKKEAKAKERQWQTRASFLRLSDSSKTDFGHIARYLFSPFVMRDLCQFMEIIGKKDMDRAVQKNNEEDYKIIVI